MDHTRRDFLGLAGAALAAAAGPCRAAAADNERDPLGCRDDFPVLNDVTYLNSPYIAPSPTPVVQAVVDFHRAKAENPVDLGPMLEETRLLRQRLAELVNAAPGEIGLLSTTSEGENVVTRALDLQAGDNVVIDDLHYDTTFLLYDELARRRGIELRVVEHVDGAAEAERFARRVDARTRLLSVSWVSHQNGFRHDLDALADLAHAHGAYLYVDAIQGLGALPLDVRRTGVDFFCAGSYKWLLGGFGIAAFYVREALLDAVDMDRVGWRQLAGHGDGGEYRYYEDARKYGYGTPAFGAVYQLRAALDYLRPIGAERIATHAVPLASELNRSLRSLGFRVLTPEGNASQIVAFEHGVAPEAAAEVLADARIKVSLRESGTQVRAGVALFNNRADVDALLDAAARLRG